MGQLSRTNLCRCECSQCLPETKLLLCRNAIILVLSNGFSIGCILSVFLHLVLPFDAVDAVDAGSASSLPTTVHPSSPDDIAQQKVSSLSCCQGFKVRVYNRV